MLSKNNDVKIFLYDKEKKKYIFSHYKFMSGFELRDFLFDLTYTWGKVIVEQEKSSSEGWTNFKISLKNFEV